MLQILALMYMNLCNYTADVVVVYAFVIFLSFRDYWFSTLLVCNVTPGCVAGTPYPVD